MEVIKQATITGHKDSLYKIEAYKDSQFFSTGADGLVVQWDLKNPTNGVLLAKLNNPVYSIAYNKERDHLAIGENFEGVHIIKVGDKKEVSSFAIPEKEIFSLAFVGENLWVGTSKGFVYVLDKDYNKLAHFQLSTESLRAIGSNDDDVAIASSDNKIYILSASSFKLKQTLEGHQNSVFSLVYDIENQRLISCGRDARICAWGLNNAYALESEVVGHMYTINHLSFSPDGKQFVTCSMDKSIKIWDAATLRLLKVIDKGRHAGHGTSVNCTHWFDYESQLVSCSDDRTISVWKINI